MLQNELTMAVSHTAVAGLAVCWNHVMLIFTNSQYCIIPRTAVKTASTASAFYLGTNAAASRALVALYSDRHRYS